MVREDGEREGVVVRGLTTLHGGSEGVSGRWFLVREMPYFGQSDSERTKEYMLMVPREQCLFSRSSCQPHLGGREGGREGRREGGRERGGEEEGRDRIGGGEMEGMTKQLNY